MPVKKEPLTIQVNSEELKESVKARNSDAGIVESLSRIITAKEKTIADKDTQLFKLYDQLGTCKSESAQLKEANLTLTGYNEQLSKKIKELEEELDNLINEEEEEGESINAPESLVDNSMISQIKEIMALFQGTTTPSINAPNIVPNPADITSSEFFGESNRGVLILLSEWYQLDQELLTVLNNIINLAKTDPAKYNLAKSML
jgi:uncharacterized coiled-coil protein SlyX